MNRLLTTLVVLAVLAIGLYLVLLAPVKRTYTFSSTAAVTSVPEPPGAAVFDLAYRGLDTPDDPLSYRSYWGFGGPDDDKDSFVQAVKKQVNECTPVYNGSLPKAQWAVVELKDKKPIAFYFDVNADGKISDNEKFLPTAPSGSNFGYPYAFLTSDLTIRTENQQEVPFRVMLVGSAYGGDEISYMWSPCCVLEGQATLAGEPMKLFLYADGFSGSFTQFGGCAIALVPAGQKLEGYVSRSTLSSLILYQGAFYRLKLQGTHAKDSAVRVLVEKDTTPTGKMALDLTGKETLKSRLMEARLDGAKDSTIHLYTVNAEPMLPVGRYKLSSGEVSYGIENNDQWRASFNEGPQFDVKAAETSRMDLGKPVLSLKAIDEKDRYTDNAKEQSTYAKGTSIYLTLQIKGKAGEIYTEFARKDAGSNNAPVKPSVTICDSDGKQVAAADMEYG
jgi:hypothetical protein